MSRTRIDDGHHLEILCNVGAWLTIEESIEYFEANQSQILTTINNFAGDNGSAELPKVHSVLGDVGPVWILVELTEDQSKRLVASARNGALSHLGIMDARTVDIEQSERDAELIKRFLAQDEDALAELLCEVASPVEHSLIKRFESLLDSHEITGAVNKAAYKVWISASRFNPGVGDLKGWFYRIAYREVLNCLRGNKSEDIPLEWDPAGSVHSFWGSTSHHLGADKTAALNEIIDQMPRLQKAVMLADLAAGERADDERLADRLESNVNSIRVTRSNARQRIRKEMKARGFEFEIEASEIVDEVSESDVAAGDQFDSDFDSQGA